MTPEDPENGLASLVATFQAVGTSLAENQKLLQLSSNFISSVVAVAANEKRLKTIVDRLHFENIRVEAQLKAAQDQIQALEVKLATEVERSREHRGPYPAELVHFLAEKVYKVPVGTLSEENVTAWLLRVLPARHQHLEAHRVLRKVAGAAESYVKHGSGKGYTNLFNAVKDYAKFKAGEGERK